MKSTSSPTPRTHEPRKKRGFFGFLFKTALGCTAFAIGSLVALILLLPTMLGGTIARSASSVFEQKFHGSIQIADAHLAWFGEQRLTGVALRDPEGKDVARASLSLPSILHLLRSGGSNIGRVALEVDGDIVQNDAGITNLQRALEPREATTTPKPSTGDKSGAFDPIEWLSRLDIDLAVKSKRLSWSDADTRRVGVPFEVRDLVASVKARPGAPLGVHAAGQIAAKDPGALEIDAQIHGPITTKSAWPLGRVDADVRIEGFSTAMVDGIANLQGNLKEVLGERFTLRARVKDATSSTGDVAFTLDGDRAHVVAEGRFEDGAFRSGDEAGLVAAFPPPRGFLKTYLESRLPIGTQAALDANPAPWTLTAKHFVLPLPPPGATDLVHLQSTLERAELDLDVAVPGHVAIQNDATRAAGIAVSAGAMLIRVHAAPGTPSSAHVEASVDANTTGKLVCDMAASDVWAKLAHGAWPIVDAQVHASDVSTVAIGAFVGQRERVAAAIGGVLDVNLDAHDLSLDAGTMTLHVVGRDSGSGAERLAFAATARVKEGVARIEGDDKLTLRLSGSSEWLTHEIAAFAPQGTEIVVSTAASVLTLEASNVHIPMPAANGGNFMDGLRVRGAGNVQLHLAGARYTNPTLRAAQTSVALEDIDIQANLSLGGAATLAVHAALEQSTRKGRLGVDASTANAWRFADGTPRAHWPPLDVRVALDDVPTALVDAFVRHDGIVGRALGDQLSIALDARGASVNGGSLSARIDAPNATVSFAGKLDAGVLRANGEDGLRFVAKVPAALLRSELATLLPADSALTWPNQVADITLRVNELSVPVPDFAAGKPFDLAATLAALGAHLELSVVGVGFENAQTRASKLDFGARSLVLDAMVAPQAPLALELTANLTPGNGAKLVADASIPDPFASIRGAPLKPIDAKIGIAGLDTNAIDVLTGQQGLLVSLLGPSLRVAIDARGASSSSGTISVDASSPTLALHGSTHVDADGVHCTGDEGLDLKITPDAAAFEQYTKKVMPAGSRLRLAPDAGALTLKLRDVAIALPKQAASAPNSAAPGTLDSKALIERVSKLALTLDADLPALVYSDAATDAAQRPITLRGIHVATKLSPRELPFARVSGVIVDEPAGEISADVRALDPLTKFAETNGIDTFRAKIDVRATKLPTAIVDVIANQGGLLVEALGARADLMVSAPEISKSSGGFSLDAHSDLHSIRGEGHIENGTLVVDRVDGLVATVGLGPVMSQRVVGKLLPTMVNVQKPAGAAPAKFSVDALHFPLDGNLRKLDGTVRIDLGEVNYALFPKLASYFGESNTLSAVKIPALTVPIQKGVAGYQRLPVKIGAHEYNFSGTYDIVTDAAQLTANVPVKLLGKKVSADLERVREYIDPELTVPLTIRGSIANPSIGLDDSALAKVLEDAGKKALGKLGGNLLDDLLKKKKKD